ncbi:hypothetical protein GobsT_45350 [Gemmata obscuriglobus]|nr:hypothetical protein GobsT_45350 [Gemmata obscuriglobus]VTS09054.1 unnamed protein product [Gemmata obscuriglobus UQM 2246]
MGVFFSARISTDLSGVAGGLLRGNRGELDKSRAVDLSVRPTIFCGVRSIGTSFPFMTAAPHSPHNDPGSGRWSRHHAAAM